MQDELYILIVVDQQSADGPTIYRHEYTDECVHDLLSKFLNRDLPAHEVPLFVKWSITDGIRVHRMDSFSPFKDWYSTGDTDAQRNNCKSIALAAVLNYFTARDSRLMTQLRQHGY